MSENLVILFLIIALGLVYLGVFLYAKDSIKVEARTYEWKNFKVRPYFLVMKGDPFSEFCIRTEKEFFKTEFAMSPEMVSNGEMIYRESLG